jgi:hypothetical protein
VEFIFHICEGIELAKVSFALVEKMRRDIASGAGRLLRVFFVQSKYEINFLFSC